jgi:hypothetical protein
VSDNFCFFELSIAIGKNCAVDIKAGDGRSIYTVAMDAKWSREAAVQNAVRGVMHKREPGVGMKNPPDGRKCK